MQVLAWRCNPSRTDWFHLAAQSCPRGINSLECSGRGTCTSGVCQCNTGFTGNACQTAGCWRIFPIFVRSPSRVWTPSSNGRAAILWFRDVPGPLSHLGSHPHWRSLKAIWAICSMHIWEVDWMSQDLCHTWDPPPSPHWRSPKAIQNMHMGGGLDVPGPLSYLGPPPHWRSPKGGLRTAVASALFLVGFCTHLVMCVVNFSSSTSVRFPHETWLYSLTSSSRMSTRNEQPSVQWTRILCQWSLSMQLRLHRSFLRNNRFSPHSIAHKT